MQKTDQSQENHPTAENGFGKTAQKSRLPALICIELFLLMSIVTGFSLWKWQRAEQQTLLTQRDLLRTQSQLGDSFLQRNQPLKTLDFYQQAFMLSQKLPLEHPENALVQRDLSVSLEKMGNLYEFLKQTDIALSFYQRSLTIHKKLAAQAPDDFKFQRDLFVGFTCVGIVYQKHKQNQLARLAFQQALPIAEKSAQDKSNFLAQTDLIWVKTRLTELPE
jgi:tetratricopeptide (TPR) repeat protein